MTVQSTPLMLTLVMVCCLGLALLPAGSARALLATWPPGQHLKESDECDVTEVHLSLAEDAHSMRVAWRTRGKQCGSTVMYGPVSDSNLLKQVTGNSYTLTESNMCTAPARHKPFTVNMHTATLLDLEPDTQYWYSIQGSSREFGFRSPPVVSSTPSRQLSFIAFGDMGEHAVRKHKSPGADATASLLRDVMSEEPVDLVLHMGDLAYADGRYKVWDSFMDLIEPVASKVPYMVGVGNHEYGYEGPSRNDPSGASQPYRPSWGNFGTESGGECGAMTARRFVMPNDPGTDNAPFWYSFDYGSVHFTIISTEHDLSPGSLQYSWLARDLAAVDRCTTPWLVVGLHRPMYVAYPHKSNMIVGDHLRDFIEDLLLEYKVDLTLAGHVHTYYRTCDVRQGQCVDDGSGVTHYVIGTGGKSLSDITDEQRTWLVGDRNEWGVMRFDVDQDTMRARFISSKTGEVLDESTVVTHLYTPEECDGLAAARAQRLADLEKRLAALSLRHKDEEQGGQQEQLSAGGQQQQAAHGGEEEQADGEEEDEA